MRRWAPNSVTTGHNGQVGQAQTTVILGNNASGSYAITATSQGQSVTGTATVTTSPPSTIYSIHVISGPGSGAPGDTLTFVVEVRANGAAKSGETVNFRITSGDANASLGTEQVTTGTNGQAQTTLDTWQQCLRLIRNHCNESGTIGEWHCDCYNLPTATTILPSCDKRSRIRRTRRYVELCCGSSEKRNRHVRGNSNV